ncbi:MAG: hypothetical protein WBZ00_03195, partial [Solirubrobacterales bacterium]
MLAAIETGTITDFVKDHPAEAYGIAGAVILLLILLLLINRRRKKERDGGEEVSPREARQAKKQAKAEAKDAKAEAKAGAKGAKAEEAKAAPSHDEAETKADAQSGDGGEGKPSRKSRREARKEKRKQIAEEKRQAEEQDRRAWEDERKRRREERRQRKEERALRKAQRKGVAPPEPAKDEEVKAERTEDGEVKAAEPAEAGTTDGEEKSTVLAAALGLGAAEAAKKAGGDGEGKSEEEEKGTKPLEEVPIGTDDESGEEASKEDSPAPTATEKAADAEQEGTEAEQKGAEAEAEAPPASPWVPPGGGTSTEESALTPVASEPSSAPGGVSSTSSDELDTLPAEPRTSTPEPAGDTDVSEPERKVPEPNAPGAELTASAEPKPRPSAPEGGHRATTPASRWAGSLQDEIDRLAGESEGSAEEPTVVSPPLAPDVPQSRPYDAPPSREATPPTPPSVPPTSGVRPTAGLDEEEERVRQAADERMRRAGVL